MRRKLLIVLLACSAILAGSAMIAGARSRPPVLAVAAAEQRAGIPGKGQLISPLASLGSSFTYQGRLTASGSPANGQFDLRFTLYDAAAAGNQVGSSFTVISQTVTDGLFTVQLDFGSAPFQGSARWLEIGVRPGGSGGSFTTLAPRQPLTGLPYALGLMPGAVVTGTLGSTLFTAENAGAGIAIYGRNSGGGVGVWGESTTTSGVRGAAFGSGAGVYGTSTGGSGVRGEAGGSGAGVQGQNTGSGPGVSGHNTGSGPGVYGTSSSNGGIGVQGVVSSTNSAVYGNNTGIGFGVIGESTYGGGVGGQTITGTAVYARSLVGMGVYARTGGYAAVYAQNDADGDGGHFISDGGHGVYGETLSATASAVHGVNGLPGPGVSGFSSGGPGVKGFSYSSAGVYGTGSGVGAIGVRAEGDGSNTALQIEDGALVVTGTNKPVFIHITTAANTSGHVTTIDNPFSNGDPNAILIVTPNWNPPGAVGGYNNHPIGVYYNGAQWAIFNQDFAPMNLDLGFNVMVVKQ